MGLGAKGKADDQCGTTVSACTHEMMVRTFTHADLQIYILSAAKSAR